MSEKIISIRDAGVEWTARLATIVETMREISRQVDPSEMVRQYVKRMARFVPRDRSLNLSRRGHEHPTVRITGDSVWKERINPWTEKHRLPLVQGGLLAELIYGDQPRIIDDLRVSASDPGAAYLSEYRSLLALPLYDQGVSLNMVLLLSRQPGAFPREDLPERVLVSNLFGRATQNLVLSQELRSAYDAVDQELRAVEQMQRALLPAELPPIPTLDLAAQYHTSRRAGGDYYDVFELPDGRWGLLIADVSGHGTPAAVLMAITHALVHTAAEPAYPSAALLRRLNETLCRVYTRRTGQFVTCFYGVYDPAERTLSYASAGHNPPRVKRCADGSLFELDEAGGLPLGISDVESFGEAVCRLQPGDQIVFYTDGITERFNPRGEMFGPERLDEVLANCALTAAGLIRAVMEAVDAFAEGRPADDDQTVLVAKVR